MITLNYSVIFMKKLIASLIVVLMSAFVVGCGTSATSSTLLPTSISR